MSYKCAYCLTKLPHLVVIKQPNGQFHVHAPFYDKKMMKVMMKQIRLAIKNEEFNKTIKSAMGGTNDGR